MKYANIISDFTWSYSRITLFEQCPYAFFLTYIALCVGNKNFFSSYGSLVHQIIERYLKREIEKEDLPIEYLSKFIDEVTGKAPNKEIFKNYFEQGLNYFKNINFPYPDPLLIEEKVEFQIEGIPFVGYIDCVAEDNGLVILDNKSRDIKPSSKRKTPTKADIEKSRYLRQLYLYSLPIKDKFYKYPDRLEFNCFRTGRLISEKFNEEELEKTKRWAVDTIKSIEENEDWSPNMEYWKCKYICDQRDNCCYFQINK